MTKMRQRMLADHLLEVRELKAELAAARAQASDMTTMAARAAVRRMLMDSHPIRDGGHAGYRGNGSWAFVTSGVGQATPEEMNALFDFAGIVPRVIVPKGSCRDCRFSVNGQERGYVAPCLGCSRPGHDAFQPKRGAR